MIELDIYFGFSVGSYSDLNSVSICHVYKCNSIGFGCVIWMLDKGIGVRINEDEHPHDGLMFIWTHLERNLSFFFFFLKKLKLLFSKIILTHTIWCNIIIFLCSELFRKSMIFIMQYEN